LDENLTQKDGEQKWREMNLTTRTEVTAILIFLFV